MTANSAGTVNFTPQNASVAQTILPDSDGQGNPGNPQSNQIGYGAQQSVTIVSLAGAPAVTSTSTSENTQTTAGLAITPAAADNGLASGFQITGISGGTLFSRRRHHAD